MRWVLPYALLVACSSPPSDRGLAPPTEVTTSRAWPADEVFDGLDGKIVRLCDFYDPSGRAPLLVIATVDAWDDASRAERDYLASVAASYEALGVRFLEVLYDGPTVGIGATPADLAQWAESGSGIVYALASEEEFIDAAGIPSNTYVDARTMTVLGSVIGFAPGSIDTWLARVENH